MTPPQDAVRAVAEDAPVFVISVAAELAGMHAQTLRQYDRLGLVSPGRTAGGGRRYSPRDVALLREVQRLSQEDGVNLAGIKRIIELESRVEALQARVHELLEELEVAETPADRRRGRGLGQLPAATWSRCAGRATRSSSGARGPSDDRRRTESTRTRPSSAWSARSACCCAAPAPSPPGWPASCIPTSTAPPTGCSPSSRTPARCARATLVARLGLDKSTVSRQVASLVDLGLVDRAPDPADGRAQVLTAVGRGVRPALAHPRGPARPLGERHVRLAAGRRRPARRAARPAQPARRGPRGRGGLTPPDRRGQWDTPLASIVVDANQLAVWLRSASIRQTGARHAHGPRDPGPADLERLPAGPHRPARGVRAAAQLYGDLPSFGWALLVPLQRDGDQRCSDLAAQAGVDASVASRQLAVLERRGLRRAAPRPPDGRASLLRLTAAGAEALAADPRPPRRTGRSPPSPAGTRPRPACSATCSTASSPTSTTAAPPPAPPSPPPDDPHPHRTSPRRTVSSTIDAPRRPPTPSPPPDVAPAEQQGQMTHRQILEALSGLLLAMFVAILSSTVVSNALPKIIADLRGSQGQYTWVVTATLLATTASTPIWGKLADLFSKKLLVQISIVIFVVGSMLAGLSQSVEMLIAWRVLQGLGLGGLQALVQIVMAAMISPRERGRYNGFLGGVMAVATVGGPLLGGVIVDTELAGLALVLLRRRAVRRRRARPAAADAAPAGAPRDVQDRLPRRRPHRRRRLAAADLGHLGRRQLRLGVGRRRCSSAAALLAIVAFVVTRCGRRSRSSRCGSSATGRRPWRSSPASPSAWRCSARRSSSASTSRSGAATPRRRPAC